MRRFGLLPMALLVSFAVSAPHAAEPENIVWRFAEKHEYGDLEPSEFCYVCIHEGVLLMHWITPGDVETIDVYAVSGKDGNGFMARKKLTYVSGKRKRYVITNDQEITGGHGVIHYVIAKDELSIQDWITLKKEEADIRNAFPDAILEKHFNYKPSY